MTKKTDGARAKPGTSLVPAGRKANALLPKTSTSVDGGVRDKDVTLYADRPYAMPGRTIDRAWVYLVDGAKAPGRGTWLGEADKVAWRDEATGYECIMMRSTTEGHLGGYVGIPPDHPLFGFDAEAVPADLEIEVHGGLTYGRLCERGPSPERRIRYEARRICHVAFPGGPIEHATDYRVHNDQWWLGFECNHAYDLVPKSRPRGFLQSEIGAVYRDEPYVYDQVVHLAAQLRAIADGAPKPPRTGPPPPPIGLDPSDGV